MRIKTEKNTFLEGIQSIIGAVTTKNALPILSNILLEVDKTSLKLTATDLDIGIVYTTKTTVVEEGSITIPAKRLIDIVKELPEGEIEISTKKNNTAQIESKGIIFKILSTPKDEFPKLPTITNAEEITVEQKTLKKMLSMTSFAMSHDETRYVLNGACFIVTKAEIRVVATDGRRLAITTEKNKTPLRQEKKIIIPTKAVQELMRALGDTGETKIIFSKNQALFHLNNICIISRLIEGEFPSYEQAIPKEAEKKLKINKELFAAAIKRASLLTTPESQAIKMQLSKNKLVVSKTTPEIGETKEDLEAEYGGEEHLIGFNPAYLLDALKNIDDENVMLEMAGPDKPAVIRHKEDYIYIVLPMQIT